MASRNSQAHMIVSNAAFEALPPGKQRAIMYSTMNNIERRVYALENKKLIDAGKSFLGGIIGGGLAILGIKWGGLG